MSCVITTITQKTLLHIYKPQENYLVTFTVLEYCISVWHYAITRAPTEQLESIQKRAIRFPLHT